MFEGFRTTMILPMALCAGLLLSAPLPAAGQAADQEVGAERREREIARKIRQFFLQGLEKRVDLSEDQLRTLLPILEDLETQRSQGLQRRRALVLQLRGLVQDPEAERSEIAGKLADLETVDRGLREAEQKARQEIRVLLDARQQAQLMLFREDFRRRLEDRLSSARRQQRQREAMREGLRPRRGGQGREERPPGR